MQVVNIFFFSDFRLRLLGCSYNNGNDAPLFIYFPVRATVIFHWDSMVIKAAAPSTYYNTSFMLVFHCYDGTHIAGEYKNYLRKFGDLTFKIVHYGKGKFYRRH